MKVEVHGTSFHVNVNAGNKSVETVLVRGCISLHALNGKKILEMNPGERVAYSWDEIPVYGSCRCECLCCMAV